MIHPSSLRFPFRFQYPREYSDDPPVRCRRRFAKRISTGCFQQRRRTETGVLTELNTGEGYFTVSDDISREGWLVKSEIISALALPFHLHC